jgi:hypothetical protein
MALLLQIDAWDPVSSAPIVLQAASVDDHRVCHLNAQTWWPALAKLPVLAMDFYGGEFGKVTTPGSSLSLDLEHWPNFGRYSLPDARLRLWYGADGGDWAAYAPCFDGRVTAVSQDEDGRATISFAVDDQWLDQPLLATYAGTGGLEGPAAQKGRPTPLAVGTPAGVPGVLLDSIRSIIQLSAYGSIEAVDVPLERLARQFGPPVADYVGFDALAAAVVAAGTWVTAKSIGCVRMGAPPFGKLCFLMKGDNAGSAGWVKRPGALVARIAEIAGGSAKVHTASLAALDLACPYDLSLYQENQTTPRQLIQSIAASVNAVAGVTLTGQLFAVPIRINSAGLTLKADGSTLPAVAKSIKLGMSAPWWRVAIGARPFWDVHGDNEILKLPPSALASDIGVEPGATNNAALANDNVLNTVAKRALVISEAEAATRYTNDLTRATAINTVAVNAAMTTLTNANNAVLANLGGISPAWNTTTVDSAVGFVGATWTALLNARATAFETIERLFSEYDATTASYSQIVDDAGTMPEINATRGQDMLVNGDAENGTAGWLKHYANNADITFKTTTAISRTGSSAFWSDKLAATNYAQYSNRAFPVKPGERYRIRVSTIGTESSALGLSILMYGMTQKPNSGFVESTNFTSALFLFSGGVSAGWFNHDYVYTVPAGIFWSSLCVVHWVDGPQYLYWDAATCQPVAPFAELDAVPANIAAAAAVPGSAIINSQLQALLDPQIASAATTANADQVTESGTRKFVPPTLIAKVAGVQDGAQVNPANLAALDVGAATKLVGIAAGATVGADYGTNLSGLPAAIASANILAGGFIQAQYAKYGDGQTTEILKPATQQADKTAAATPSVPTNATFTFEVDYTDTVIAAQLPYSRRFVAYQGATDVSSSTNWVLSGSSVVALGLTVNNVAAAANRGVITGTAGGNGTAILTATLPGGSVVITPLTFSKNPPPPAPAPPVAGTTARTISGVFTAASGTLVGVAEEVLVRSDAAAKIKVSMAIDFTDGATASAGLLACVGYSTTPGGALTALFADTLPTMTPYEYVASDLQGYAGSISLALTQFSLPAAGVDYYFRIMARRSGVNVSATSVTVQVQQ